jgi:NTP pyrophosphatase (non-canonical NTP hydrolase)
MASRHERRAPTNQAGGLHMPRTRSFQDLLDITRRVIAAFDRAEQRPWSVEVTMIELAKQVGDLAKRVLMFEGYYLPDRADAPAYVTTREDLADELADILYCVIRVADHYRIDLEQAHLEARRKELRALGQEPDF